LPFPMLAAMPAMPSLLPRGGVHRRDRLERLIHEYELAA
jgi:hypothetical protein